MLKIFSVVIVFCLFCLIGNVYSQVSIDNPQSKVINFSDTPFQLGFYNAQYKTNYQNKNWSGIIHSVEIPKSLDDYGIAAMELIFLDFNIFKEYTGFIQRRVYTGHKGKELYLKETDDDSFYAGYVFVSKVRYKNGDLWEASVNKFEDQLESHGIKYKIIRKILDDLKNR